ncbi:hypothetical protein [Clostridium botulinum]
MEVYCDKCKNDFEINIKTEKIKGDIERIYFICPHCGENYTSYYLNNRIRTKQEKAREFMSKIKTSINYTERVKYINKHKKLMNEIKNDMDELKKNLKS